MNTKHLIKTLYIAIVVNPKIEKAELLKNVIIVEKKLKLKNIKMGNKKFHDIFGYTKNNQEQLITFLTSGNHNAI